MTMHPRTAVLAAIAVAAALTLAACGDSGSSEPTSTGTVEASGKGQGGSARGGSEKPSGNQSGGQHGREKSSSSGSGSPEGGDGQRHVPVSQLEISGGGSAQFQVKGGDNSVQDYGEEAAGSELRQAAESTHAFLVASVRGEWARACGLLTANEQQSIESAAGRSPQVRGKGCAPALAAFTQPVPGPQALEITQVDAASLRHEGEQGFLIYVGAPDHTVYAMPMRLEGGVWKLGAISGVALPGVS